MYLVALERENSILANAPPDKMAAIEHAIKAIDVDEYIAALAEDPDPL
mgnify:CR=1 FL=1